MNLPACGDHPLSGRTGWRIYAGVFTPARRFVRRSGTSVPVSWGDVNSLELRGAGQTHLNSDAKIGDQGHPQGVPLPIVFFRRYAPWGGHPQGVPLPIFVFSRPGEGTHKGCPYLWAVCPGEGTHKGRPYQIVFSRRCPGEGTHKGCPYHLFAIGRYALGRAPTRGAPTNCFMPWGGHPQGVPLPYAGDCPGEGTHKGCPYHLSLAPLGRAPTRGAPTICLLWRYALGRADAPLSSLGRICPGEAPTRGAPTRFRQPVVFYLMQLPCGFDRIPLQYVYWRRQFNRFLLRCAFRPDARRTMGEDR